MGLALNTVGVGAELNTIRIMGVLQRFAICYLVVAILVTFLTFSFKISEGNKPGVSNNLINIFYYIRVTGVNVISPETMGPRWVKN